MGIAAPGSPVVTIERGRTELGPDTFERLSDLEVAGGSLRANHEWAVTGTQCAAVHDEGPDGAWPHVDLRDADGNR